MFGFIREMIDVYTPETANRQDPDKRMFSTSLNANIAVIENDFNGACDLTVHRLSLNGAESAVISMDNMVNKDMLALGVIKPLLGFDLTNGGEDHIGEIKSKVVYSDDVTVIYSFNDLYRAIMSGFAVIAVDGCDSMLSVGIQGFKSRSISEPDSDVVRRGAKEGFVEPLRTNIALLRRRLKTPDLKLEIMNIGKVSDTEVCICYLGGKVSDTILLRLKKRLSEFDADTVLASGYLVPYLEEKRSLSPFCTVGVTERPDTLCGKLTEGRIGVLIDGVPCALIVPYLFVEYFQTVDDYTNRPYFAFFTRWLKYASFFVAMLLPAVFVALGTFNPEMFPTLMLNKIAGSIADTPLSLTAETMLILLVYEIMRESGLRMPRPLGYAVSIVGGLVVGDTAVNAGLIGAPTLMVVAAAAICSYVIPDLYAPVAILRLVFTLAAGICGIWGVAILLCLVFLNLCAQTSYGVPYTSPVTPFGTGAVRDVFIRAGWKILSKRTQTVQKMPGSAMIGGECND